WEMADSSNPRNAVRGSSFHIHDCYVWSEIYYLDSATDYREYLPQSTTHSGFGELMMLESSESFLQYVSRHCSSMRSLLLIFILGGLALGLLIGIALDSF